MPQEFQVLRCYTCQTFQVHQVKKTLKWNCKMCGEKQSIKKVFGRGSGADCRKHVQKCNMLQGENGQAEPATLQPLETEENFSGMPHQEYDNEDNMSSGQSFTENVLNFPSSAGAGQMQGNIRDMFSNTTGDKSGDVAQGSKWSKYMTKTEDTDDDQGRFD